MTRSIVRGATALITAAALAGTAVGCASTSSGADADAAPATSESVDVVDDQGRTVHLDAPAQRAVVIGSFNVDLALALGARDQLVGTDAQTIERLAASKLPGSLSVGANGTELNAEAIVAKDADVVLIYRNHGWQELASTLEPFDIPVVVLSTWVFDQWDESIDLAATVLGREKEAAKVHEFSDDIAGLLERSPQDPAEQAVLFYEDSAGKSTGNDGGKNFAIEAAGVRNLFGDVAGNQIDIDPEAVVAGNPDLVAVETTNIYGGTSDADYAAKAAELTGQPGWPRLDAVTSGNTFLYNAWAFDLAGNQITPLFFAKWAYPELYEDVDPLDYVQRWADEYLGITDFDPADGYVHQLNAG
ncbi:periplasmic binding protein [Xylanimonas cellulosilytica DSM 15894]|uniref:Periplasmic binding protein n=1 Tax=Xylanimonas cellulosilytica (strain DSM 15894 / JCM 12276 / CECT 5975 / KCTC 9989 / LMG 20990 / NBRC 107835 / XIL07) TaxID=446471 RepID=D1BVK8_XYLCX|nr:ABC transporter substrate-binding protein [Xylanimonas cellulosilytica]ACZ31327.1 periplasmic binding protein [Xylanimonas cellulosilytica DSM 15894]